ncbi:hypothetical protein [Acidovorax sp. FJL06]|nr:hypothetical protein [Acidovorax sp. FJL06]
MFRLFCFSSRGTAGDALRLALLASPGSRHGVHAARALPCSVYCR